MVLKESASESIMQIDSSKFSIGSSNSKSEDIRWLIDNLPVTVFRASHKPSLTIRYINKSVEKLTAILKRVLLTRDLHGLINFPRGYCGS